MQPYWISLIKAAVVRAVNIKRYWKLVTGFIAKVSTLPEAKEAKQIENMAKYLEAVAKQLTALKRAGVSEEKVRALAVELNVPLIQANLEAMLIARQFSSDPQQRASSDDAQGTDSQPKVDTSASDSIPPSS